MTIRRFANACVGFVIICQLGACAGGLLGGGRPDNLYRFGISELAEAPSTAPVEKGTLILEKVRFASQIDGDRLLAVHDGSARYIKGSRWVTSAPSLFAQALLRTFQLRVPGVRTITIPSRDLSGYSLSTSIGRFEAQYDDADMARPPTVRIEGDASLYALSDRRLVAQRHFVVRVLAVQNRVDDIVIAFDRATGCFTVNLADWVSSVTENRVQSGVPVCPATP
jgi:cholesterol transport system auxiliary component